MPTVRITETYDLSTKVNAMGIVGIHTPSVVMLTQTYPGLMQNYKKLRVVGCDVVLACASMLPADPLQIGTEAGSIAPQDMFNPMLYTAVSNDSFNRIIDRIKTLSNVTQFGSVGADQDAFNDPDVDDFNIYYGLLANTDGWKRAMPQSGLAMRGLYPIVYQVLNTYGSGTDLTGQLAVNDSGLETTVDAITMRGASVRLPPIETDGTEIPTTYVACIITPPAKLHKLYYRMSVTWTFEFLDLISITERGELAEIADVGIRSYGSDYQIQSANMSATTNSVDVKSASIEHIMTATR